MANSNGPAGYRDFRITEGGHRERLLLQLRGSNSGRFGARDALPTTESGGFLSKGLSGSRLIRFRLWGNAILVWESTTKFKVL